MGVSSDGIGPSWIRLLLPNNMLATAGSGPCELSPGREQNGPQEPSLTAAFAHRASVWWLPNGSAR